MDNYKICPLMILSNQDNPYCNENCQFHNKNGTCKLAAILDVMKDRILVQSELGKILSIDDTYESEDDDDSHDISSNSFFKKKKRVNG